jgi:hypothetical protein
MKKNRSRKSRDTVPFRGESRAQKLMEKAPIMELFAYGPFKLCPGRQAHMINRRILSPSGARRHSY